MVQPTGPTGTCSSSCLVRVSAAASRPAVVGVDPDLLVAGDADRQGDVSQAHRRGPGWLSPRFVEPPVDVTNHVGRVPLGVNHLFETP